VKRGGALLLAAATLPALVGLRLRPLLPIDETRYLTVAWEMWHGTWLVPHLNGRPYSDKPPLLFWLIDAGWLALGVREWWARLLPPLLALASLLLVRRLAGRLWPGRPAVAALAPFIALGAALWAVYLQLVLFDTLLTLCVLLGVTGAVEAWRAPRPSAWILMALGFGLGVLAKGPVALLHLLPLLLLAPWWMTDGRRPVWRGWYVGVGLAFLGGAALALAWAVPAARAGGPDYANSIFLRQTAERVVSSFAHRRGPWWYLPLLPILLFPWALWPPLWRAYGRLRSALPDAGVRFCLAWAVPVFVAFSLISGKQVHYLFPLIPAFALLSARLLDEGTTDGGPAFLPALVVAAGGVALLLLPHLPAAVRAVPWLPALSPWPGLLLLAGGVALSPVLARLPAAMATVLLALVSAAVLLVLEAGVLPPAMSAYDMRPVGAALRALELDGFDIAHSGNYAGQYQFAGRLERPLVVLPRDSVAAWLAAAPRRAAVTYERRDRGPAGGGGFTSLLARPYRDRVVRVLVSSAPGTGGAQQ
jgi:4-amino-4-deoxy-L-arabinose transferase-like glycosyltransferase